MQRRVTATLTDLGRKPAPALRLVSAAGYVTYPANVPTGGIVALHCRTATWTWLLSARIPVRVRAAPVAATARAGHAGQPAADSGAGEQADS